MRLNKKLTLIILGVAIIIGGSSLLAEAATHTHTAECGLAVAHVHKGNQKVKDGCYQGSSIQITCGTGTYEGKTQSYTNNQGASGSTVAYATCNSCGAEFTVGSVSWGSGSSGGYIPPTGTVCTHKVTGYTLSCGYTAGEIVECYFHTHTGVKTEKGGCFQGDKTTDKCGAAYASHYSIPGASGTGYCGGCNAYNIHYDTYNVMYECGHSISKSSSYCTVHTDDVDAYFENFLNEIKTSTCSTTETVYAVSCGYDENTLYDGNGNVATLICNKKIKSIAPKTKNQTLVK